MKTAKNYKLHQVVKFPQKVLLFAKELISAPPQNTSDLEKKKRNFSARNKVPTILNRDIIAIISRENLVAPSSLLQILQKRSVRTISGVTPVAILTRPFGCPGKCIYCPSEPKMPKSYISSQPAAARALRNKFHPREQTLNRLAALVDSGHPVSKLEIIIMGGTWSALPAQYQEWFIKEIFDTVNECKSEDLKEAQKINETADRRIIGLTTETRPDFITEKELMRLRKFGCTRVELGVQTLDDKISRETKRNCTALRVAQATELLKNYGFKICYHMMPGLPGSTMKKDLAMLKKTMEDPRYSPDFVKIYPCQVLKNSELYDIWKKGKFEPLHDRDLVKLILRFKKFVPPWVRIMRLLRDIPVSDIVSGAKFSNLRQILHSQPEKIKEIIGEKDFREIFGSSFVWPCKCIRCRELGFVSDKHWKKLKPVLKRRDYQSSGGTEVFLSFETSDEQTLFSLLRLRIPGKINFKKSRDFFASAALIREIHSYGSEISVGQGKGQGQHRGLGKKLIREAEKIAKIEFKKQKMVIIAGVGTREYYRQAGYTEENTYMVKDL